MKKLADVVLLITCLLLILAGCSKTADNKEEMLQIIVEEEEIADELLVQTIETIDLGDTVLVCVMTGNENQGHQYYAAEFIQKDDKYEFVHIYKPVKRGTDMYVLLWNYGYVFISNNENSKSLQIYFPNDEHTNERVAIDAVPFVYYLDLSEVYGDETDFSFEYYFYNEMGEVISD